VLKEFGVLITCVTTNRWPQLAQTQLIYVDLKKNLSTNQMPQSKMSKQMPLKLRRPVYEPQAPRYNCATRVEFYLFSFVRLPNATQQRYVLKKTPRLLPPISACRRVQPPATQKVVWAMHLTMKTVLATAPQRLDQLYYNCISD
jgi:hypothetical protein